MKLRDLIVKLKTNNAEYNKGLWDAEKRTNKFGGSIKKIGGLIAGAFAVSKLVEFSKELFNLGSQAEGVRAAFKKIGGDAILGDLKNAVKGTVSELDLMKQAVQANNFDIPLSQLATLFEFARRRAKATGESVEYLTQSLVLGLGRRSIMILDNLGISSSQLADKLDGVGVRASSVGQITKAVGEIADEAMSDMAEDTDTAAESAENLSSSLGNVKEALGGLIIESAKGFGVKTLAEEMDDLANVMNNKNIPLWQRWLSLLDSGGALARQAIQITKAQNTIDTLRAQTRLKLIESLDLESKSLDELHQMLKETKAIQDPIAQSYKNTLIPAIQSAILHYRAERKELEKINQIKYSKKFLYPETKTKKPGEGAVIPNMPSALTREDTAYLDVLTEQEERTQEFVDKMGDLAEDFKNSAVAGFSDGMQTLTDSIISGQDIDAGAVVAALLTPLADMAIRTGEVAVATGIGVEAIKASLESLSGIGAIAAGVALIAVGTAAKSALKAAAKGSTTSGGTSSRNQGSGLQAQPVTGGSSIIQGGEAAAGLTGGGSELKITGKLVAERGTLTAVLERENNERNSF